MFQDLRVIGLGATVKYQTTFGSLFDPHSLVGLLDNLRHPPVRDILSGFSGVVRPGEMLRAYPNTPLTMHVLIDPYSCPRPPRLRV